MSQVEWSTETKQLIAATVGKGLTKEALLHLQHVSLSKGLDPLANEIYAIPKGQRTTLIVAIGGMLKLCSPQLDGCETVWFDDQGQAHSVWIQDGSPKGCQVTVWRKGCTKPFTAAVRYSDFAAGGMWAKMGSVMIRKVALAHALRTGFADLLSGLYSQEEMDQAGFERPAIQTQSQSPKPGTTDPAPSMEQATAAVAKAFNGEITPAAPPASSPRSSDGSTRTDVVQPSVVDQLRSEPKAQQQPEQLPNRDDLQGALAALWKKAQSVGLTSTGWRAMEHKLGHKVAPSEAHKLIPHMTEAKALELNSMALAA